MSALAASVAARLHGRDVWAGFSPNLRAGEVQGWNGLHPALTRLGVRGPAPLVVDVGVWKGQSTITIAGEMKRQGVDGCVVAVDTFLGGVDRWGGSLVGRSFGWPDLFQTFMSNVWHAGLADYVVPLWMTTGHAAEVLASKGVSASMVHLDSVHDRDGVLRDAEALYPLVEPGGHLVGDDYHETWPGVVSGAADFAGRVGVALSVEAPKWIVQRPRR